MLVKTDGIVLKQIPYSESSVIVKVFTREYGLISFFIKGSKSPKSNRASILKPMNHVFISFHMKDQNKMSLLSECQLKFAPDAKVFGIHKSAVSMMMIEVINNIITVESHPDIEKFDFLTYSFQYLKDHPLHANFYLSFLIQFSNFLGISIPTITIDHREVTAILDDYTNIRNIPFSKLERKKIFDSIELHYKEHIPNYKSLKSIGILEEIL